MSENPSTDVVKLTAVSSPAHAHILEQKLKDAGIDCKVVGDFLSTGVGGMPGMPAEVWVNQADEEKAKAILEDIPDEVNDSEE